MKTGANGGVNSARKDDKPEVIGAKNSTAQAGNSSGVKNFGNSGAARATTGSGKASNGANSKTDARSAATPSDRGRASACRTT